MRQLIPTLSLVTLPLAAAMTLAVGCGGGSPPAADTPPAPTADQPSAEQAPAAADPAAAALHSRATAVFQPLPAQPVAGDNQLTDARVDLGRALYYEPRLSKNHDVSCNSCHKLDGFGVDNQPTSSGHKAERGGRNSPTVFNAALHFAQFWDGRAADVEEQAGGPMLNPVEMAMASEQDVTAVLRSIPGYAPMFAAAFPDVADPVDFQHAAVAIGAFERGLLTPGDFDRYLGGDLTALTADEQAGLAAFMDAGCTACHAGATLGGQMYQKMGLVQPYDTPDLGRFEVTGNEADKQVFKVPGLRNIEKTGPWFHDGSITELDQAVALMGRHQLGKELSAEQVTAITHFLGALTASPDPQYIEMPELPASGPDTPAPDPS